MGPWLPWRRVACWRPTASSQARGAPCYVGLVPPLAAAAQKTDEEIAELIRAVQGDDGKKEGEESKDLKITKDQFVKIMSKK